MKSREDVTTNGRAAFYAAMWNDFIDAAMDKGWALGLSDMDIMAMKWTESAGSRSELIDAIRGCFDKPEEIIISKISSMPNNRKVFTLSIWSDFYLDINIIEL